MEKKTWSQFFLALSDRLLLVIISLFAVMLILGGYVYLQSRDTRPPILGGPSYQLAIGERAAVLEGLLPFAYDPTLELYLIKDYRDYVRALDKHSPIYAALTFEFKILQGYMQMSQNFSGGPISSPETFVSPGIFSTTCDIVFDPRGLGALDNDPSSGQFYLPWVFFHELGHCVSPYGYWDRSLGIHPEREEAFADVYSIIRLHQLGLPYNLERLIRDRAFSETPNDVHEPYGLELLRGYKITDAPASVQARQLIARIYPEN